MICNYKSTKFNSSNICYVLLLIKHQLFDYIEFNDESVLFLTIPCKHKSFVWTLFKP